MNCVNKCTDIRNPWCCRTQASPHLLLVLLLIFFACMDLKLFTSLLRNSNKAPNNVLEALIVWAVLYHLWLPNYSFLMMPWLHESPCNVHSPVGIFFRINTSLMCCGFFLFLQSEACKRNVYIGERCNIRSSPLSLSISFFFKGNREKFSISSKVFQLQIILCNINILVPVLQLFFPLLSIFLCSVYLV